MFNLGSFYEAFLLLGEFIHCNNLVDDMEEIELVWVEFNDPIGSVMDDVPMLLMQGKAFGQAGELMFFCGHCGERHAYNEFVCRVGVTEAEYWGVE